MRTNEAISSIINVSCCRPYHAAVNVCNITAFAQDAPNSEEYMAQHDGGDRAAYLQEMEHNDPPFYVPPAN